MNSFFWFESNLIVKKKNRCAWEKFFLSASLLREIRWHHSLVSKIKVNCRSNLKWNCNQSETTVSRRYVGKRQKVLRRRLWRSFMVAVITESGDAFKTKVASLRRVRSLLSFSYHSFRISRLVGASKWCSIVLFTEWCWLSLAFSPQAAGIRLINPQPWV